MLRIILRIVLVALVLFVLIVGIELSTVNSDLVTVNYFLGTAALPLSLVVVCAFTAGVLVAVVIGSAVMLPLRMRVGKLKRAVTDQENEISALRRRS